MATNNNVKQAETSHQSVITIDYMTTTNKLHRNMKARMSDEGGEQQIEVRAGGPIATGQAPGTHVSRKIFEGQSRRLS